MQTRFKDWWNRKIIRTKFLFSIFLGLLLYQGVTTTYQINNVKQQIIDEYRAKALTISFIVDCIVLKDNELLFNLLERSGDSDITQITVNSEHPSCVDRERYLTRLKTLHFDEFTKAQQSVSSNGNTKVTEELETTEEVEEVEEVEETDTFDTSISSEDPIASPSSLQFTTNLESVKGELKTYTLQIAGETLPQIEYKAMVNGLTIVFNLNDMPNQIRENLAILIMSALGNLFIVFGIVWFVSGRMVAPLIKLKDLIQSITEGQGWWQQEQSVKIEVYSQDEIGQLSRSFNNMLGFLNDSYTKLVDKHNEVRAANREISHINEVVQTINSTLDLDTVMHSLTQSLQTIFNFNQIGLALLDDSQQIVRFHKMYGKGISPNQFLQLSELQFDLQYEDSPFSATILEKKPVFLPQVSAQILESFQEAERQMYDINPAKTILMCPLEVQKTVQGLIFFGNPQEPFDLNELDIEKIQRYVVQIAIAINNARLYEDLKSTQVQLTVTKEIAAMTKSFEKFVPNQFLRRIAKTGFENIEVGKAETDHITILFSDIRSFTNLTEAMSPQELLNFLNAYLERMNEPIHANNGFIDKFIGDAIMALFDRHEDTDSDEAVDAVMAALSMQKALIIYNKHRHNSGYQPIKVGIGIHSGPVIFGTVGSELRMDSTVLGDAVNLASRLEALTKYYNASIIISEATFLLLKDSIEVFWRELDYVLVKGKDRPVKIYEIFDNDPHKIQELKRQIRQSFHEGLAHYRAQRWEEALSLFQRCLNIYQDDTASQIFVERCTRYQTDPPAPGWDGSIRLEKG